jgi:hypothetical protein
MRYMMLALPLALLAPLAAPAQTAPPIRLKLSDRTLAVGQRARIRVQAAADGYLVVLRTDPKGNVQVLYPVNPTDPGAITGGKEVEIKGRGGREAFAALGETGSGAVLAAWADHPFTFTEFDVNGHWTRAGVVADSAGGDAEAAMLGIVDRMSDGPYKYDVVEYTVRERTYRPMYTGWYDPWFGPWYGGAYAPWGWYPFGYGAYGYAPYVYAPYVYGPRGGIVVRPRGGGRRAR